MASLRSRLGMIYLLIGYMWLFIHRPFEVWPVLGAVPIERLYIFVCLLYWALLYPRKTWVSNRLNAAFAFFCLVFLVAWIASPYHDWGTKTVEDYFKLVCFYVLVMATVRDEQELRKLVLAYLVIMGIYMTHSFREFLCGRHEYRMGIPRMNGVDLAYNDPNTFAATILYSLPITLAFWPEAKKAWHRRLLYYYVGLSVVCIIETGSRSGFLGLVLLSPFFLKRLIRRKLPYLLALALLPLLWMVVPAHLQNRFWTVIDPSVGPSNAQGSAESRTEFFFQALELWRRIPFSA